MMNIDEVLIHRGLCGIPFGSTPEHVQLSLGIPGSISSDDDGDLEFSYEDLALRFRFWKESSFRLGSIISQRQGLYLSGTHLFAKSEDFVTGFIIDGLQAEISEHDGCVHDDGETQTWIDVNTLDISFWFLKGELYLLDWGVRWRDEDTPDWEGVEGA